MELDWEGLSLQGPRLSDTGVSLHGLSLSLPVHTREPKVSGNDGSGEGSSFLSFLKSSPDIFSIDF